MDKAHKKRHAFLHANLDELLADFVSQTGMPVLSRPIEDLLKWSHEQTKNPTKREEKDDHVGEGS